MKTELELLAPERAPALFRKDVSATTLVVSPTLGAVQVADELGFAYLSAEIDFGATGRNEIHQNIKYIVLTEFFSVPLDREFGLEYSMVDKPMAIAEAIFSQEVAMKISLYEPRAQFRSIDFVRDEMIGKLSPSVKVVLLTTSELPRSLPLPAGDAGLVPPPGGIVTTITEVDLPLFYATMIELARVPGPPGPIGAPGVAATIEVGTTTTGDPGTDALVTNVGDEHFAIFDFVIPRGDKGDQGEGVNIEGSVPDSGALPTTGNDVGDIWIDESTGDGWSWNGTEWVNIGPIQGPPGPQGDQGIQGIPGNAAMVNVGTTTTGAPGSNANVSNSGTSSAAVFNFTIPRGDVGAQGPQGVTGSTGSQGPAGNAATVAVGTTTTGAAGTSANVSNSGSSLAAVFNFTIPRGDTGAQGIQGIQGTTGSQGPAGPANNLTVAATNTGAPGTNANVVIAGTTPNQNLTFTIPQGNAGPTGANGANAFTTTAANFDVPAVGNSVLVTLADASWVTIGQMVVVQTSGGSPTDAYSLKVIAKAGNQVTLQNIGTSYVEPSGDMSKSVYDTDNDSIVDRAELADHATDTGGSSIYCYQDHFLTGSDGSYTNWTNSQGTGAAKTQVSGIADHPGIYALTTGTQAGAAATGYGFITSGNSYAYGTGALAFRAVLRTPTTKPTNTAAVLSKIYIGLGTQPANGVYPGADFVGFVFDPSSGMANAANNWGLLTRKASANTFTDTGFVFATTAWADLSFYVDPTGAYFRANTWAGTTQAKSAAITSNVPLAATPLCMVWHVVNGPAGTTSYQSQLDSWEVAYRANAVIPVFRGADLIKNF